MKSTVEYVVSSSGFWNWSVPYRTVQCIPTEDVSTFCRSMTVHASRAPETG